MQIALQADFSKFEPAEIGSDNRIGAMRFEDGAPECRVPRHRM
jgi:hypothetical protein